MWRTLLGCALTWPLQVLATSALHVPLLDGPAPALDGRLDDAAWAAVPAVTAFAQAAPQPGAVPTRRTELRLVHDGITLFVAVRAFEPQAAGIVAQTLRHDAEAIDADDHIALVFDPQGSGRNGYLFRVNALGARRDALVADGSISRREWDGLWDAQTATDEAGWTAEIAIPLALLAAPADGRAWGFNAERLVARSGERLRLYTPVLEREVDSLMDTGRLTGIAPASSGWGLRLQPSVRVSTQRRGTQRDDASLEPTLDALWAMTPTLAATFTLNTDFSDAELDDRVVSLSRFELFRPERRPFFTQDANRFSFGGLESDEPALVPFFSRRIALGRTLDAGLKLSGTAGPVELGAFAVHVPSGRNGEQDEPRSNLAVLRAATGLGDAQRLGLIATQGDPSGLTRNRLAGLDWQYRSTGFLGSRTLAVDASTQRSQDGLLGTGSAHAASLRYPNIGLTGEVHAIHIDAAYRPALGYVQETGLRRVHGDLGWWHRTDEGANVIPRLLSNERRRLDGTEASSSRGLMLEWSNARGDYITPEWWWERERVAAPFQALPGVVLGTRRDMPFSHGTIWAGLSASRPLSGEVSWREGGFYEGHLSEQSLSAVWRPHARWSLGGSLGRQQVKANGTRFTARSSTLGLEVMPDARTAHTLVLQHDNVSQQTTAAVRSRWELSQGREIRVALDRSRVGLIDTAPPRTPDDWRATASMRWTFEQ